MEQLIIQIKHGGLGDHLFYSHIPRIAKESGKYSKILISNLSDLRNKDYKKLVWESNPHVDGFTDEAGVSIDAGDVTEKDSFNLLDKIMLGFGLDDGKRFHEPEIYYKPKNIPELNEKIIYDPNYISNAGFVTTPKVTKYFKKNGVKIDYQLIVRPPHSIPVFKFGEFIKCDSFWDFIDVVYSAKKVYCLVTGTATLLPALGKSAEVLHTKDIRIVFRHSKLNNYIEL
jgi:hypothetical protein